MKTFGRVIGWAAALAVCWAMVGGVFVGPGYLVWVLTRRVFGAEASVVIALHAPALLASLLVVAIAVSKSDATGVDGATEGGL